MTRFSRRFVYREWMHPGQIARLQDLLGAGTRDLAIVGPATLHDHALSLDPSSRDGKAVLTIRPHPGSLVHGVVLDCSQRACALIDDLEGVYAGSSRIRKEVQVFQPDGTPMRAITSCAIAGSHRHREPLAQAAFERTREGLHHWGLPTRGLDNLAAGWPGVDLVANVFVYGTLLPGASRDGVWARHAVRCVQSAQARGQLYTTDDDYPAAVQAPGDRVLHGDVLRVAGIGRLLHELDDIEEYRPGDFSAQLFRRTLTTVTAGGKTRRAWIYVAGELLALRAPIASGSWREHLRLSARD